MQNKINIRGYSLDMYELLIEAKKLIENGWCQGAASRDRYGRDSSSKDRYDNSVAFCVTGAIREVGGSLKVIELFGKANNLAFGRIISWNDNPNRTKKEILKAFEYAIIYAKQNPHQINNN